MFTFKDDFKRWVKVLYTDISSCVINNGFASPFFKLKRGVRQGCPLSGLLFVLAIELLALAIKNDPLIQAISVGKQEIKLSQYADDATVSLETPPLSKCCSAFCINLKTVPVRGGWQLSLILPLFGKT